MPVGAKLPDLNRRPPPRPGMLRAAGIAVVAGVFGVMILTRSNPGGPVTPFPIPALTADPGRWLNSPPLAPGRDGKVYLVEAWSYG